MTQESHDQKFLDKTRPVLGSLGMHEPPRRDPRTRRNRQGGGCKCPNYERRAKDAEGNKRRELKVNPTRARDLLCVKVCDRITFSYDPDQSLVVAFTSSKPMTATHLLKVLRRLDERDQGSAAHSLDVIRSDQDFLFGYLMGIADACRSEFTMPTGKEWLGRFREHLLLHLERNRDRLEQPAVEHLREAIQSWESQPAR